MRDFLLEVDAACLWEDPPFLSVPPQRFRFPQRGGRGRKQPAGVRRGRANVRHPAGDPGTRDGCGGWTGQAADGPLPVQILRGLQELCGERQRSGVFLLLPQSRLGWLWTAALTPVKCNVSSRLGWNNWTVFVILKTRKNFPVDSTDLQAVRWLGELRHL